MYTEVHRGTQRWTEGYRGTQSNRETTSALHSTHLFLGYTALHFVALNQYTDLFFPENYQQSMTFTAKHCTALHVTEMFFTK